ncbi:unnamed protein product [Trichogramma brassicae]|uniref:Uncharacterized protein n=1 Tax=Trichogramma brassicae TaxID=86971 RepID=A0A6H5IMV5_9HYME|nr:unnamed protein product [Trichogramma brassicae]
MDFPLNFCIMLNNREKLSHTNRKIFADLLMHPSGGRRNILNNAAYNIFERKETTTKTTSNNTPQYRAFPPSPSTKSRTGPVTHYINITREGDTSNSRNNNYTNNTVRNNNNISSQTQRQKFLQRSTSADNVVVKQRGFKPSDRHDPAKRNILESLTKKILHFDMVLQFTCRERLQFFFMHFGYYCNDVFFYRRAAVRETQRR